MPDVVALVSMGLHAVSRRARRADLDARALELALRANGAATALHAGPAARLPALRDFLGMGAERLVTLDLPSEADPLPALERYLEVRRPDLIVAGARAEAGEGSGVVPFILAERLGYALATGIVELAIEGRDIRLVQALAGGRRRTLASALPLVAIVDRSGPDPRLSAQARARRGPVTVEPAPVSAADARDGWVTRPSRPRPRRLLAPKAAVGTHEDAGSRRELVNPDPLAAADAILDFLAINGLFDAATSDRDDSRPGESS